MYHHHAQVPPPNFYAETRTNSQVPRARSLMPEGYRLAAASQDDLIRPSAGVELYTAAAMVFFSIEPTIWMQLRAGPPSTEGGACVSLRHSSCKSATRHHVCQASRPDRQLPNPRGVCGCAIQVTVQVTTIDTISDDYGPAPRPAEGWTSPPPPEPAHESAVGQ